MIAKNRGPTLQIPMGCGSSQANLPIMGIGGLGVFTVTGVTISAATIPRKLTNKDNRGFANDDF